MIPAPRIEYHAGVAVVRDDDLTGGTKEAAIMDCIAYWPELELVYASPRQGYAQIALAAACKRAGRDATLFVAESKVMHPRTAIAASLGAKIIPVRCGYLSVIQAMAREYCKESGARLLPFGLATFEMEMAISRRALLVDFQPEHVWSVAGSGTLQRGLQRAWPDATFTAIQIGKEPNAGNARVLIAPEKYERDARIPPPFPSCSNYDAKAWQFIPTNPEAKTLFWNVAS